MTAPAALCAQSPIIAAGGSSSGLRQVRLGADVWRREGCQGETEGSGPTRERIYRSAIASAGGVS
jgi:hypothetical protein